MSRTAIIGGGISGIACAVALADHGVDVQVRERSRSLGGRLASRTLRGSGTRFDGRVVDIGASYFTATDAGFAAVVAGLEERGVVRRWADGFHVAGPAGIEGVSGGPMRFAAPHGLRSIVETLVADRPEIEVRLDDQVGRVDAFGDGARVDGEAFDGVALCMPQPQAVRIVDGLPPNQIPWEPVIAVTMVFSHRSWRELDGVFVNGDAVLTWIADDGRRRGDEAPVLVAHVRSVLSARHLDDVSAVIPSAIAAVQRILEIDAYPEWFDAHRWTFSKPLVGDEASFWLDDHANLGLAGDAWAGGPRVEAAWLSGHRLGVALAARLADPARR